MKQIVASTIIMLLFALPAAAQRKSPDRSSLTPQQVLEMQQQPHPCADGKSRRLESAAKRLLYNQAVLFDGNQADYDVRYYGIDISIDFANDSIDGHVDYQIRPLINNLSAVDLNLHWQLHVDSVWVDSVSVAFSHLNDLLMISTPEFAVGEEFSMRVFYNGRPVSGYGYANGGMGFAYHYGNTVCWTATEPFASRNWWPCKDYPADKADSLDVRIERPGTYEVASNGVLVSDVDVGGGRKRAHWKHNYPIVTYLVAISVSDFIVEEQTWNYDDHTMPVLSYTFPNAGESRQLFADWTIPMLDIYSDAFGIYPFVDEKLANINCGIYGTMEHQTCSFHDPFSYYDQLYLLIHENGHQWWGDMITCHTFNHIWLNEGITTWTEAIFYEALYGHDFYHDYMQGYAYKGGGTIYVEDI
jgi:aminopeptidase N